MTEAEGAIAFVAEVFGDPITQGPIYFSSLANERDGSGEIRLSTRDQEQVAMFIKKNDRPGRGIFVCAGTVNGKRNKDNILESAAIYTDIDFKDHPGVPAEAIRTAIGRAKLPPSIVVSTGHGYHVWYLFHAAVNSQTYRDRLESLLRALAVHFGGDPQVAEISRLMRLPGTHNTKYDSWVPVTAEITHGNRYSLNDLEGWLLTNTRPLLQRRAVIGPPDPGGAPNPFLAAAAAQGYKPPIDVEAMLEAMVPGTINETLERCTAALLSRGEPLEEVLAAAMAAFRTCAEKHGATYKWKHEERKWRRECRRWLEKHPELLEKQKDGQPDRKKATNLNLSAGTENVVDLGEARAKRKPKPKPTTGDTPYIVADGVIQALHDNREDLMLTEGEVWLYQDGFWRILTPSDEQRLRGLIQTGFETIEVQPRGAQLALAWTRLTQHPKHYQQDVPWADAGMIVCRNGVLRIETGHFDRHQPDTYARRHVGATFTPGETCPVFERLLASMFCDRPDAIALINLIQEWAGAALAISSLSREQRRALVLVGPSRTGKTELARIFALLLGDPIATPAVSELGERFGLSSLYGATAWIRDDAINEGDKLDPQRFKTIVTGEPINIELKGRHVIQNVRLNTPVLLTCNSLPRARDGSDAIFNRSIVLEMTSVVADEEAKRARTEILGKAGDVSLGAGVFEKESAGILNWAILGLARLRRRGFYDIPESVATALQHFKDENNPVGEWAREAVAVAKGMKVERRDLVRSYNGWETDMEGDEARTVGGRWLLPKLRARIPGLGDIQGDGGRRYITGIKLTDVGKAAWDSYAKASAKPGGFAATSADINQINLPDGQDGQDVKNQSRF
jgi:P4 family phage/plasmid primase-like protien